MRHWIKARGDLPCSLCDCLLFENFDYLSSRGIPSPTKSYTECHSILFHVPCESCSQHVDSSDCCAFCQHFRMQHLFHCFSKLIPIKSMERYASLENFAIDLGSLATLKSRKRCPVCRFFYDTLTARYRLWQQRNPWGSNPIILEFSKDGPALREAIPWHASPFQSAVSDVTLEKWRTYGQEARFSMHGIREHSSTSPVLSSKVNWSTLRQWRRKFMPTATLPQSEDLCSQHTSTLRLPQSLLVIDVQNGCIVSKPTNYTYAALSYVWGSPMQGDLQATLANINDLAKPGALKQAGVPLTILDAMTAASKLRIPYLWVDRLCIVQDDSTTKHDLINQMNSIYANALVTFVAAAGKDASYGLPGVSNKRSSAQAHLRWRGIELMEVLPKFYSDTMPRMAWMKRGWTYQEAIFSANLIFFTNHGVFYERMNAWDDVLVEPPNLHGWRIFSAKPDFFQSVKAYSERTLSYETDMEKAFSGVLQSHYGEEHAYGSPLRFFDSALRWTPKDRLGERRQSTEDDIFPSWSWLSAMGRVDFSEAYLRSWSLPVATWAMILPTADGKSKLRLIGLEKYGDSEIDLDLLHVAWKAGFCKGRYRSTSVSNAHFAISVEFPFEHSTREPYEYYWRQIRGLQSTSVPTHLLFPEEYHNSLRPGQVLVHTRSACFPKTHSGLWSVKSEAVAISSWDYSCDNLEEPAYVEAIALSITNGSFADFERGNLERFVNPDSGNFGDLAGFEGGNIGRGDNVRRWRVDVMLIRRVDGVAYRTGFGWVTLETWEKAKPTFKNIVLG